MAGYFDSDARVRWAYLRASLGIFLLLLVVVTVLWLFLNHRADQAALANLKTRQSSRVVSAVDGMTRDFSAAVGDLQILAGGDALQDYISSPSTVAAERLTRYFALFCRAKRIYNQVRLLDASGIEQVRVDYRNGVVHVVPHARLQDKSHRYYYQEAVNLPAGGIFVSPLDLNIEHGEIERPLKPMLRFAAPVFGDKGRVQGVVVLNYFGQIMFRHVQERLARAAAGDAMVLNPDGFVLFSLSGRHDWGFLLRNDSWSFPLQYPGEWARIRAGAGQLMTDAGLFTFSTAFPLLSLERLTPPVSVYTLQGRDTRAYFWTLVSHVTPDQLHSFIQQRHGDYLALYIFSVAAAMLLSLSYGYVRINRRRRQEADRLAARVMDVSRDGVLIANSERRILSVNHAFSAITGFLQSEVTGLDLKHLHLTHDEPDRTAAMWREVEGKGVWRGETWMRRKDGARFAAASTIATIGGTGRRTTNYVEIFTDISDRKAREEQLIQLAHHDALTGLPNRYLFADRLDIAVATAARRGEKVGLLFVDLDRFKPLNDRYGHEAGDRVLREVAKRLRRVCHRRTDTAARLGGDEFVVLLPGIDSSKRAGALAAELESAIVEPMLGVADEPIRVGASIGMAVYPDDAEDADTLIRKADKSMYIIKRAHRVQG